MKPPLVSVITVVRNAGPMVEQTLQSVFSQEFKDYEYLVLDGASTDDTVARVQPHAHRLAYFHSERDGGIYDAMNRAIARARGEFIYFLNAGDCFYGPDSLGKVATQLDGVEFYSGRVRMMSLDGADLQRHYPEEGPSFAGLTRSCCIAHQATFVRRELMLRLGGFDESLRSSADYEFWFRLRAAGIRARFAMEVVAWYRDGGLSASRNTRHIRNLEDVEILWRHGVLGQRSAALLRALKGHPPLRRRLVRWFGKP